MNDQQPAQPDPTRPGRFTGKVAVVTGGAGGLGQAISAAFLAEGASVQILDANTEAVAAAVEQLRSASGVAARRVIGSVVDVREPDQIAAALQEAVDQLGRLDVLVAAAGGSLGTPRDLVDIDEDALDLVIDVNLKGTFFCAQAAIPHMRAGGGGAIVTFSSIGGRSTSPVTGVPYAAAKAGILGLTRRLAREVGPDGIRVNAIAPGLFLTGRLTGMFDAMSEPDRRSVIEGIPLARMPELRECVDPVLFLASDEASYITGVVLDVNGGRFMSG